MPLALMQHADGLLHLPVHLLKAGAEAPKVRQVDEPRVQEGQLVELAPHVARVRALPGGVFTRARMYDA